MMQPPIEPNKDDCCNSGCNPCIFDVYERQVKAYKKFLETGVTSDAKPWPENGISQTEYTKFTLVRNLEMCKSHKLLVFKKTEKSTKQTIVWKPGDHFLMKYAFEDTSCTRAYTPIKKDIFELGEDDCDFAIIVKCYNDGLVSKYLYNLKEGELPLWRGPYGSYELKSNTFDRIVILAQGTGIAPCIGVIENILSNEDDMTKIILYYCCASLDQILLRSKLYSYKQYWNFTYNVFVNDTMTTASLKYQEPVIMHRLSFEDLLNLKPCTMKDQYILCGSLVFMKEYKTFLEEKLNLSNVFTF